MSISGNINYTKTDGYEAYIASDIVGNSGYTHPTSERKNLNLNMDYKGFYFMGQYSDREEGPNFGAAKALNERSLFNYESYFVEVGHKKEISDRLSIQTRLYYDKSNPNNKIEVFPQGFPAPFLTVLELSEELRSIQEVDRDIYAFYGELLYDLKDDLRLTIGGRYDHFSDFGGTFNPRVGAA